MKTMLQRLYAHNFRCLENFEFKPGAGHSSALLIGKNGAGKSTLLRVLGVFQAIGRGTNRVAQLVEPGDLTRGRIDVPMRLELEVVLSGRAFHYTVGPAQSLRAPQQHHCCTAADEPMSPAQRPGIPQAANCARLRPVRADRSAIADSSAI